MRSCYGRGAPLRAAIYVCCLSAFLFFGYDQGVFGGLLQNADWLQQFDYPSDVITGITVSSYCLGAFFGCVINFVIGDVLGRRRMIWLAMGLIVIGASLQASAYSLGHLIAGRVITGLGTGVDSSTIPMYQSELSKKHNRGQLVSWEIFFIGVGICLAYWIDYGFSFLHGAVAWRTPIALQLVFAVVVIFVVWGCPESPRWLAKKGREEEAAEVLCAVYDLPRDDPYIVGEIEAIRATIATESDGANGYLSLLKKDHLQTRYRMFLAWFGLFINQWSGINLVIYYLPTVLVTNVGLTPGRAQLIAGCVELMFPIGNLLPAFRLDSMGRKKTIMIGSGLLSFCMMMITILLSFNQAGTSSASIAFFFLYLLIFGATVNVVPWVWGPELAPLQTRAKITAVSVSSHWLWNFCIVMITPVMISRIGWRTYIVFTLLLAVFVPIVYFAYPETSGLSLEEIDNLFLPADQQVRAGSISVVKEEEKFSTESIEVAQKV